MRAPAAPAADALAAEVSFQAQRGRGPGGQNVNKVASCALLAWNFEASGLLTAEQKARLRHRLSGSLNSHGEIQLRSDEFRDLERNKARALEKLAERVAAALFVPKPRKATRPTRASRIRLKESKTRRSQAKKLRSRPDW
jgi:ribosome-associated protein